MLMLTKLIRCTPHVYLFRVFFGFVRWPSLDYTFLSLTQLLFNAIQQMDANAGDGYFRMLQALHDGHTMRSFVFVGHNRVAGCPF